MFVQYLRNIWENKNKMDESTRWLFYSILVETNCQLLHFEKVTIIIIIRKKTQLYQQNNEFDLSSCVPLCELNEYGKSIASKWGQSIN